MPEPPVATSIRVATGRLAFVFLEPPRASASVSIQIACESYALTVLVG
jgi:hypothetical protein